MSCVRPTNDKAEDAEHVFPVLREWPISCLLKYRPANDADEASYLVDWEPSNMTLDDLCADFQGMPLLRQVHELHPREQQLGLDSRSQYRTHWKPTWMPLSDLHNCTHLIHEFWSKIIFEM